MKYFDLPRGLRDYDPQQHALVERIREAFVSSVKLYGYQLMEPSSIEFLETLEAKSGEEVVNEIYAFKDKAGRDLGLRFDLTVGITRYICSRRETPLPFKAASFASVWRYDEPQFGRYRWFYQWDVEEYNTSKGPYDYLELFLLIIRIFRELKISDVTILVNDRRVAESAVKSVVGRPDQELLRAMDKLGKKGVDEIVQEYVGRGYSEEDVRAVLGLAEKGVEAVKGEEARDLLELLDLSRSMNLPVKFDMSIVRGLDYYSDIVFEVYSSSRKDVGALAGGGGYDLLPALFGRPELKALGVAGGVDRIALVMPGAEAPQGRVAVCYLEGLRAKAVEVAEALRDRGVAAQLMKPSRLSAQLSEAERGGYRFAVLVLPEELSRSEVRVKDMVRREEEQVGLSSLAGYVLGRL